MLEDYRPISLMVAFWPTGEFEFPQDPAALAERLQGQFGLWTEKRLVNVQAGQQVPPEVPRLVLLGDQRQWVLELGPTKVTLRYLPRAPQGLEGVNEAFRQQLVSIQSWLAEALNLRVYRLGWVLQLFCNTRSSANEKIAAYFLQPRALQGSVPHEVQVNLLSRLALANGMSVNRWLRVRPLRSVDPRRVDFAAQIEVDINTLPEETSAKSAVEISAFLDAVHRYVRDDLPLLQDANFFA